MNREASELFMLRARAGTAIAISLLLPAIQKAPWLPLVPASKFRDASSLYPAPTLRSRSKVNWRAASPASRRRSEEIALIV
jgi:hypothetical protein